MRFFCILALILLSAPIAHAESLSVTVTPPLIQLTIGPGENWRSALKVVNNNTYDVTYYAQVVDFEAEGESGQGRFVPLMSSTEARTHSLASWIQLASTSVTVLQGHSGELPFTVEVPAEAEPGGHYAAILVGTQPGKASLNGPSVAVSSFVSSLIFVRIKGDVIESGRIREFRASKTLYETPQVDFILRFENTGNAHLRPQGDITLYNMWGKERGKVLINHKSDFGNVLPKSTRKFEFSWEGKSGLFDIGRYSAEVTLSFGEGSKQNVSASTFFWVIPVVPVSIVAASIVGFILLVAWLIRRYIRRALMLEKFREMQRPREDSEPIALDVLVEPIREGVVDLRRVVATSAIVTPDTAVPDEGIPTNSWQLFSKYKLFFLFIALVIAGGAGTWWYFAHVLSGEHDFQIREVRSVVE